MSFFKRHTSNGVDYKARLQNKLYLSKEAPEPSFDLSDCDLKVVPKGIFSVVRVLRKESLSLKHNSLTSLSGGGDLADLALLTVLDLSHNNFKTLPENISVLTNLAELYLNNNYLKTLPEGLCQLTNLRVLSVPFNKLKKLPSSMSSMISLREISLQGNLALNELPTNLCLCPRLSRLILDTGRYTFPPDEIVHQGTAAVLRFLAKEMGVEYRGISDSVGADDSASSSNRSQTLRQSKRDQHVEAMLLELEQKKQLKQREQLAIEKELVQRKEDEFRTHSSLKEDKDKLVENLKAQQQKIAREVMKFQSKKENERTKLVEQLKKSEENADVIISRLLEMHKLENDPSRMIKLRELDRQCEETLFHERLNTDLKKKDIIASMEKLLEKEIQKVMDHEEAKAGFIKESLFRELEVDGQLAEVLFNRSSNQTALQERLVNDDKMQQAAVAQLLVKSDLESAKLRAQLKIMETQLARLTAIELKKKSLNENCQDDLLNRRSQLSDLFAKTLKQREERTGRLLARMRRMEELWESDGVEEDYWMKQYQKLLNCHSILDSRLIELMVLHDVHEHLPLLLEINLDDVTVGFLTKLGLQDVEAKRVFEAVKSFTASSTRPSAPPLDASGPSAPPVDEGVDFNSECVVCMNDRFEVVFLPCGHLCCCLKCSDQLSSCPLCRTQIDKKVQPIDFLVS